MLYPPLGLSMHRFANERSILTSCNTAHTGASPKGGVGVRHPSTCQDIVGKLALPSGKKRKGGREKREGKGKKRKKKRKRKERKEKKGKKGKERKRKERKRRKKEKKEKEGEEERKE